MMRFLFLFLIITSFFRVISQTTDAQGRKQGYWKKKDEKTGKLIYEGEFKDNIPLGKFKYYYPNDTVQAVFYFRKEGTLAFAKLYHFNGKRMAEGKYVNELKGNDINRVKDSTWAFYDEEGVLISRDVYTMGRKNGKSLVYLPDGTLAEERNYKNDVLEGPFKQYFGGKKIRGEGNYVNGNLDGKVVYYFPNGVQAAAGYYKNGCKNGPWIYKKSNGSISEKELYKNCKLATEKETNDFFSKNKPVPGSEKKQEKKAGK